MLSQPLRLRAGRHLQDAWLAASALVARGTYSAWDHLEQRQRAWRRARSRLELARRLGLTMILPYLQQELLARTHDLRQSADGLLTYPERSPATAPPLRWWTAELLQIEADFGGLTIDWKARAVCAVTEPITLEDVYLGPFALRFFWERLVRAADPYCFDIVALEPNPSGVNDDVTHPHVKHEKVCLGEAAAPLKQALEQGRLADAFALIRSVLLTYNPRNPFVALEDWEGTSCHDCERAVPADDLRYCEGCSHDYCENCLSFCHACEDTRCSGCLERCGRCRSLCCQGCLQTVTGADVPCCPQCRRTCAACRTLFVLDSRSPEADRCPTCRPLTSACLLLSHPVPVPGDS